MAGPLKSDLVGKTVLVTGAASGIGEGIARGLAGIGVHVLVGDIERERGQAVAASIAETGAARFVHLDVGSEEGVEAGFAEIGKLDGLVNVAGILTRVPLLEMSAAEFDRVIAVNLRGYFLCVREAAKRMIAGGHGGAIVNICSTNAHHGTPGLTHYGASKGGVLSSTRGMALELAPHGIRVNSVSPGVVATALNADRLSDPAQVKHSAGETALGRIGQPSDLFGIVELLLSERSSWITGADMLVDGGELAG